MQARKAAETGLETGEALAQKALAQWLDGAPDGTRAPSVRSVNKLAQTAFWARACGEMALAESLLTTILDFAEANPPGYIPDAHMLLMAVHAARSDRAEALRHLARAVDLGEPVATWLAFNQLKTDPFEIMAGLRHDRSFVELVDQAITRDRELVAGLQRELPGLFS